MTIDKWLAARPPIVGDAVYDVTDPRHIGEVIMIRPSGATVRWNDSGWITECVPLRQLRRADNE